VFAWGIEWAGGELHTAYMSVECVMQVEVNHNSYVSQMCDASF